MFSNNGHVLCLDLCPKINKTNTSFCVSCWPGLCFKKASSYFVLKSSYVPFISSVMSIEIRKCHFLQGQLQWLLLTELVYSINTITFHVSSLSLCHHVYCVKIVKECVQFFILNYYFFFTQRMVFVHSGNLQILLLVLLAFC